jgi:hypothetical protein
MASCDICRNGFTALGHPCPNGCTPATAENILERLNVLAARLDAEGEITCRDAIGEIVRLVRLCVNVHDHPKAKH